MHFSRNMKMRAYAESSLFIFFHTHTYVIRALIKIQQDPVKIHLQGQMEKRKAFVAPE